jgi:hypothetical protein
MNATNRRLSDSTIEQARHVSTLSLAERYSQLSKLSSREWAGPCPKCGGTDRFHVKEDWFFCRQCNPKGGDTIAFVRWLQPGLSFADAVAQLTGRTLPTAAQRKLERAQQDTRVRTPNWSRKAAAMLHAAQERLLGNEGEPGHEYLASRGLDPRTWLQFGLGYSADVNVPGTGGKQKAAAISMPWYAGSKLTGLRYRFLVPQDGHKQTAETGSQFSGRLFGRQGLPDWVSLANGNGKFESMCDLIICEGEINAMSIWQVARDTNLHVLSLGSESAKLTDAVVAFAKRYRIVIIWADRAEMARNLQTAIPIASGLVSPNGRDANDLMCDSLLGAVLSMARLRACRNDYQREGLLWDLWDAAQTWIGVDSGTVQAMHKIAGDLGKALMPRDRHHCVADDTE